MTLVWANTTSSVVPASLSSSFSPMQAITLRSLSKQWATFWPISCKGDHIIANQRQTRHNWIQPKKKTYKIYVFRTSSLSPKTCRLSECPRITQSTPQSLIIAGLQGKNCVGTHVLAVIHKNDKNKKGQVPDLPSEGAFGNFIAVLGGHTDPLVQLRSRIVKIDGWSSAHHLCVKNTKLYGYNDDIWRTQQAWLLFSFLKYCVYYIRLFMYCLFFYAQQCRSRLTSLYSI